MAFDLSKRNAALHVSPPPPGDFFAVAFGEKWIITEVPWLRLSLDVKEKPVIHSSKHDVLNWPALLQPFRSSPFGLKRELNR